MKSVAVLVVIAAAAAASAQLVTPIGSFETKTGAAAANINLFKLDASSSAVSPTLNFSAGFEYGLGNGLVADFDIIREDLRESLKSHLETEFSLGLTYKAYEYKGAFVGPYARFHATQLPGTATGDWGKSLEYGAAISYTYEKYTVGLSHGYAKGQNSYTENYHDITASGEVELSKQWSALLYWSTITAVDGVKETRVGAGATYHF